jgi:hypothetical protein
MALAFYVDNPDALAKAFAAHDEYMAVLTYFVRGKNSKCRMLTPDGDNYYSAPFCFMPKHLPGRRDGNGNQGGQGGGGGGGARGTWSSRRRSRGCTAIPGPTATSVRTTRPRIGCATGAA